MIKNIVIGLFLISFLNGCVQSTVLVGPAYTLVSTGNIYNASLTYGSSKAVEKITGKTPVENIKSLVDTKDSTNEDEDYEEFFALVKSRIEKTNKILNPVNQ